MCGPGSGIDITVPSIARVYDYWLGGGLNFPADQELAAQIERINPWTRTMARRNRAFLARAVTWAASQGISQFIDAGAGLPTRPAVHESARAVRRDACVVYVDNDPVVLCYSAAILGSQRGVTVLGGDVSDPAAVLAGPGLTDAIGLARPVCVILASMLQFFSPEDAAATVAGFMSPLAPGSALVISVPWIEPEMYEKVAAAYSAASGWDHDRDTVASWIAAAGLELVPPGITAARTWRAGMPDPRLAPEPARMHVGVALKPLPGRDGREVPSRGCHVGPLVAAALLVDLPDGDLGGGGVAEGAGEAAQVRAEQHQVVAPFFYGEPDDHLHQPAGLRGERAEVGGLAVAPGMAQRRLHDPPSRPRPLAGDRARREGQGPRPPPGCMRVTPAVRRPVR
jgi:O-methyltransferase involved in polyketide biosynthesis